MDGFPGGRADLFDILNNGGGFMGGGGGGGGLFGQMFGGMNSRRRPRKGETTVQPLSVTLEDLYKGKTSKLQLTKKTICKSCGGAGGKAGAVQRCDKCSGTGRVYITRQIGPGMIQQTTSHCNECNGEGEKINEKDRCKTCNGRKTVQEQKIIEVNITRGMRENQKVIFYGEGDQEPGVEPGDVVLVVKTKSHDTFERKGNDLFTKQSISLNEALCGFTRVIQHLDGRSLVLTTVPGEVIKPESIRVAANEGMPIPNSSEFGKLYVVFEIKFPANYFLQSEDLYKKLESLLPPRPVAPKFPHEHEEVSLSDFDPRRYQHHDGGGRGRGREAYDDDESDDDMSSHMGGQRVQCAQQ